MNKKALVVMAHGSRSDQANTEFESLIKHLSTCFTGEYDVIAPCFLELADPSLMTLGEQLYQQGIRDIDFYPLFFNQGRHVQRDVPNQIQALEAALDGLKVHCLPYFGANAQLASVMASHIKQHTHDG